VIAAAAFALLTLALGWLVLAPIRRPLGAVAFHSVAYPIGLLSWTAVACASALLRHAWTWPLVLASLTVFAIAGFALAHATAAPRAGDRHLFATPGAPKAPAAWTYAAAATTLAAVALAVQASARTAAAYDSIFHYQSSAIWLFDTGRFTPAITGAYGALIPSTIAGNLLVGLDWTATVWPVLALHVIAWVGIEIYGASSARLSRGIRAALAVTLTALLATTTPFLAHTLYVHSHMISACYLLLAVLAVRRAFWVMPRDGGPDATATERAWLLVAGVATAGLVLARPDGLAYAFGILALVAIARFERARGAGTVLTFLAGLLVPVAAVYGTALLRLGFWTGPKLSGKMTAALIAALLLVGLIAAFADRVPGARGLFGRRGVLLGGVLAANAALVGVMAIRNPEGFAASSANMIGNLTHSGGYGNLWYVLAALVALSLATWRSWTRRRWPALMLYAIVQFFVIAIAVHGTSHPGRLSPADSFSRVAFHAVPLIFVYAGYVVGGLLETYREDRDVESA